LPIADLGADMEGCQALDGNLVPTRAATGQHENIIFVRVEHAPK